MKKVLAGIAADCRTWDIQKKRGRKMRRKDRAIEDFAELLKIIEACAVCRVAMQDEEGLYIVPLSFGYSVEAGVLHLYMHSAKEGRKVRAFNQKAAVAFEMDCGYELTPGETACQHGCRYQSVVGSGRIAPIESVASKQRALEALMRHLTGTQWSIQPAEAETVQVYDLTVEQVSGKARR